MGFKIVNALLINLFMLRVFSVAAILKCETKEEEIKQTKRVNLIKLVYLPAYFLLQVAIFSTDIWLFSS